MKHPTRSISWLIVVAAVAEGGPVFAGTYDQLLDATAQRVSQTLKSNATSIVLDYRALPSRPGGGTGFTQNIKDRLQPLGLRVEKQAEYGLIAEFKIDRAQNGSVKAQLIATIRDRDNREVAVFRDLPVLDDPKDLAEVLGVSTGFGPSGNSGARSGGFAKDFDRRSIELSYDRSILYSDPRQIYGVQAHLRGRPRPFAERRPGLAYTTFEQGDEYTIALYNGSDQEAAVDLKIDGVNTFYFSDETARKPDGSKYKYWIVAPRSTLRVVGWHKNDREVARFEVSPASQSAAVIAGAPTDEVGMVSATFYETVPPPEDRPAPMVTEQPSRGSLESPPPPPTVGARPAPSVGSTNGAPRRYESMAPSDGAPGSGSRGGPIGTGLGRTGRALSRGVQKTIGAPRATVVFRYDRP